MSQARRGGARSDPATLGDRVDVEAALVPVTPLGRLGRPADVADIVAFLTGHDGRRVAGQNLRASDGLP